MSFHQGAKVHGKEYAAAKRKPVLTESTMDRITFEVRNEAHRMALSNINKPWARRWLKARRYS